MIVHRGRWCPVWVGIVTMLLTTAVIGAVLSVEGRDRLAMLPLLFTGLQLTLLDYTTATVSSKGVLIREGIIPAAFRGHRSGEESHWAVVVASGHGEWIDLLAQYEREMPAQQEVYRVGQVLGIWEVSRAQGVPPRPDRRVLWALLYWFGLVGLCFALAAMVL